MTSQVTIKEKIFFAPQQSIAKKQLSKECDRPGVDIGLQNI